MDVRKGAFWPLLLNLGQAVKQTEEHLKAQPAVRKVVAIGKNGK